MKQKINQWIKERLGYVVTLFEDPRYDITKHGFFVPFCRAFFYKKTKYKWTVTDYSKER